VLLGLIKNNRETQPGIKTAGPTATACSSLNFCTREVVSVAILDMRLLPDPILRTQAKKVGKVTPQIKTLVANMIETMRDQQGVGLAANQIGSLQKIAVVETPELEEPLVLINPEVMKAEGEREVVEG
jgi:peptide deformylase|tara:strand:- start:27 stop:410 length:384 start_codon:yes stop_codon:yes gene_type:complete